MQLVDKDDGVLALHEFFHDGFEAFFKLTAVLGAGDDEGKIERKNALVGKERRNITIGDALRKAFDNGRFANAGLANQNGIVFCAAAENLDDAFDLVFATDEGIQRAF